MNSNEKIIFNQKFTAIKDNGMGNISEDTILYRGLEVLLNSKEFEDTSLKISNLKNESNLLSLIVRCKDKDGKYFEVSGLYYVTDGKISENRSFYGEIHYNFNEKFLSLNIERYTKEGIIKVNLAEEIKQRNNMYDITTSYSGMDLEHRTITIDGSKVDNFLSYTAKRL